MDMTISFDGSCFRNPGGKGGYAALIISPEKKRIITGNHLSTTNNRMEMLGLLSGLREIKKDKISLLNIVGDSEYVLKGTAIWMNKWEKKQWPKHLKNLDLWKPIFQCIHNIYEFVEEICFWHCSAHSGIWINEFCDEMASEAAMRDFEEEKKLELPRNNFEKIEFSDFKLLLRRTKCS